MNHSTIKSKLKRYLKKRKERKYIKVLAGRSKAEVTVETAIVFTIILVLICSMIYFSLYLHDIVTIKAYTYSGLVEGADKDQDECRKITYSKLQKTPVFVTIPTASVSWLQSASAVILEPKKVKSVTVSIVSPCICHEVMGSEGMIIVS